MTPPKYTLGENIKRERTRQWKTMKTLADEAGMHSSEICRLEHGQRDPRLWTLVRIADALDVSLAYLLRGIGKPPASYPRSSSEWSMTSSSST